MQVNFSYNEDRDVECLITKGPGSTNSPGQQTATYKKLLTYTNEATNPEKVCDFVREYLAEGNINPTTTAQALKNNWDLIGKEFEQRAEKVFGLCIKDEITAFLTIAGRFPYNIRGKYFFVSMKSTDANLIAMHELWHFYTYRKFESAIDKIGYEKFNDLKESLTVLLNIECPDLMKGEIDNGYTQHQQLRKTISSVWLETKDIQKVWETALEQLQ